MSDIVKRLLKADKAKNTEDKDLLIHAAFSIIELRQQLADTQRKLEAAEKDECAWADYGDDNMPGTYEGDCGIVWTFTEGGIADNECIYCPRCGGKIIDRAIEQSKGRDDAIRALMESPHTTAAPSPCTPEEAAELAEKMGVSRYRNFGEDGMVFYAKPEQIAAIINADRSKR